jgi:Plasmid replication region DNA-binding N-term
VTDYNKVSSIVDRLLAEGLHPSADRVRSRLGSGSNQRIQGAINARLRELDRLPEHAPEEILQPLALAAYSAPPPEPVEVQRRLDEWRRETWLSIVEAQARAFRHQRPQTFTTQIDHAANTRRWISMGGGSDDDRPAT